MKTPTNDEIAGEARRLWLDQGSPKGRDIEIWLTAERRLKEGEAESGAPSSFAERTKAETAAESVVEYQISPAIPEQDAIKAAMPGRGERSKVRRSASANKGKSSKSARKPRGKARRP